MQLADLALIYGSSDSSEDGEESSLNPQCKSNFGKSSIPSGSNERPGLTTSKVGTSPSKRKHDLSRDPEQMSSADLPSGTTESKLPPPFLSLQYSSLDPVSSAKRQRTSPVQALPTVSVNPIIHRLHPRGGAGGAILEKESGVQSPRSYSIPFMPPQVRKRKPNVATEDLTNYGYSSSRRTKR